MGWEPGSFPLPVAEIGACDVPFMLADPNTGPPAWTLGSVIHSLAGTCRVSEYTVWAAVPLCALLICAYLPLPRTAKTALPCGCPHRGGCAGCWVRRGQAALCAMEKESQAWSACERCPWDL